MGQLLMIVRLAPGRCRGGRGTGSGRRRRRWQQWLQRLERGHLYGGPQQKEGLKTKAEQAVTARICVLMRASAHANRIRLRQRLWR